MHKTVVAWVRGGKENELYKEEDWKKIYTSQDVSVWNAEEGNGGKLWNLTRETNGENSWKTFEWKITNKPNEIIYRRWEKNEKEKHILMDIRQLPTTHKEVERGEQVFVRRSNGCYINREESDK